MNLVDNSSYQPGLHEDLNILQKNIEKLVEQCNKLEEKIKVLEIENKKLKSYIKNKQHNATINDNKKEELLKKIDKYIQSIDKYIKNKPSK